MTNTDTTITSALSKKKSPLTAIVSWSKKGLAPLCRPSERERDAEKTKQPNESAKIRADKGTSA